MWPLLVVPLPPIPNDLARLLKRLERVLPDTLFFKTAKESFNDPVLLWCVGRNEFLLDSIVSTGLSKAPAPEDEAIVAAEDWRPHGTQRPEPRKAGRFDRPLRLLRSTAERKLVPDDLPIMTIDHGRPMPPAIVPTGNMRHIHRPSFVALAGPAHPAPHPGAGGGGALVHTPSLLLQHAIHRLPIDDEPVPESQQHPQPSIPKRGMLLNPLAQPLGPRRVGRRASRLAPVYPMQAGSAYTKHPATPPLRDIRQRTSHASDVFRSKG